MDEILKRRFRRANSDAGGCRDARLAHLRLEILGQLLRKRNRPRRLHDGEHVVSARVDEDAVFWSNLYRTRERRQLFAERAMLVFIREARKRCAHVIAVERDDGKVGAQFRRLKLVGIRPARFLDEVHRTAPAVAVRGACIGDIERTFPAGKEVLDGPRTFLMPSVERTHVAAQRHQLAERLVVRAHLPAGLFQNSPRCLEKRIHLMHEGIMPFFP